MLLEYFYCSEQFLSPYLYSRFSHNVKWPLASQVLDCIIDSSWELRQGYIFHRLMSTVTVLGFKEHLPISGLMPRFAQQNW